MRATIRMDIKIVDWDQDEPSQEDLFEALKKLLSNSGVEVTYIGGSILPPQLKTAAALLPEI
jgi:hypothetical protein